MTLCVRCHDDKPDAAFTPHGVGRRDAFCRDCYNAARRARYAANTEVADARRRATHRYRRLHPEKVAVSKKAWADSHLENNRIAVAQSNLRFPARAQARSAVRYALRSGHIQKAICWCGEVSVEAHHHLGYTEEHRLDVRWLCRKHHRMLHRIYPEVAA